MLSPRHASIKYNPYNQTNIIMPNKISQLLMKKKSVVPFLYAALQLNCALKDQWCTKCRKSEARERGGGCLVTATSFL